MRSHNRYSDNFCFFFVQNCYNISKRTHFLMVSLISLVASAFLLTIPKRKENNLLNLYHCDMVIVNMQPSYDWLYYEYVYAAFNQ